MLARFLVEGHYASHIRRMRAVYSARRDALIHSISKHFGNTLPVLGGDAGLHLALSLPRHLDDHAVARKVLHAGVATRPLSFYCMLRTAPAKGLLLGYGTVREEEIEAHFSLLARTAETFL